MKLIQAWTMSLRKHGHKAFILVADGKQVRERLWAIGERRWTCYQKKNLPPALRCAFNKEKMPLPELDYSGETLYLLGW